MTRSRHNGQPRSDFTADNYAPPGLRTGGFALARSGRASQMAETLDRQTTLQNDTFDANGDLVKDSQATPSSPEFYEEDLTRGHRIDVFHEADGKWRSLMWRAGTYDLINLGDDGVVPVVEEDTVVVSPTTASNSASDPGDLYLQETLTRWGGWSLAVPRIGAPMHDNDSPTSSDPSPAGFAFSTSWHVPGDDVADGNAQKLPRLRFDQTYQFRARGVDHAGNSLLVDHARHRRHRHQPPAAPRALRTGRRPPVAPHRAAHPGRVERGVGDPQRGRHPLRHRPHRQRHCDAVPRAAALVAAAGRTAPRVRQPGRQRRRLPDEVEPRRLQRHRHPRPRPPRRSAGGARGPPSRLLLLPDHRPPPG